MNFFEDEKMVDKFKGLEGKISKEIQKLKNVKYEPDEYIGSISDARAIDARAIEAYEQVLKWIVELNKLEIIQADDMIV